ncbi:MAG: uracil-DNA glycosylase [Kiritimatiellia bacterium]|nr:uracil-DNA glycosylase [Kiritimatiellia bacterium]
MRGEPKQMLARIAHDIKSYIEYLKENDVTEVVSFSHKQQMENGRKSRDDTEALPPEAGLKKIAAAVAVCKKCPLYQKRTNPVPGQGNSRPEVLFIGEGPGEEEDRRGLAFVGRAGQLLTRLIVRMGFTREQVFIANIVKCRPPNNRKPLPEEMNTCRPYLEQQIAVLKPKVIVLLGATALESLITSEIKITKMRGQWLEYHATGRSAVADKGIPTMPTFHPSYLLRNQSAMWDVWNDMQQVLTRLGRTAPPRNKQAPK